jgi:hypothetical protein
MSDNNRSFWEFWVIDSALRGQDPISRFIVSLYTGFWIPIVVLAMVCFLTDTNFFFVFGLLLKGIWWFIFGFIWYMLTHFDKVVWFCRNLISPGSGESNPPW